LWDFLKFFKIFDYFPQILIFFDFFPVFYPFFGVSHRKEYARFWLCSHRGYKKYILGHRAHRGHREFFLDTDLHCLFQQVILQITLCSKQRLCSKRAFAPAVLLCPQTDKASFVETKHGYETVLKR